MNNMSDTKRTTQSWRRAALNHTSPFSAFIPLALALLRSPNSHKPMGAGSSPTGKLQSCARCVIFHSWKPGSGSRKPWADREIPSSFRWCWNSYIAYVHGGHALGKSPSGNRTHPQRCCPLKWRDNLHNTVQSSLPTPFGRYMGVSLFTRAAALLPSSWDGLEAISI